MQMNKKLKIKITLKSINVLLQILLVIFNLPTLATKCYIAICN